MGKRILPWQNSISFSCTFFFYKEKGAKKAGDPGPNPGGSNSSFSFKGSILHYLNRKSNIIMPFLNPGGRIVRKGLRVQLI